MNTDKEGEKEENFTADKYDHADEEKRRVKILDPIGVPFDTSTSSVHRKLRARIGFIGDGVSPFPS